MPQGDSNTSMPGDELERALTAIAAVRDQLPVAARRRRDASYVSGHNDPDSPAQADTAEPPTCVQELQMMAFLILLKSAERDLRAAQGRVKETWRQRAELAAKERALEEERLQLEAERRVVEEYNAGVDDMVRLNVGGHELTTTRSLLTSVPGSMLCALLSGRHEIRKDGTGAVFLDRDYEQFRYVLNYLRTKELPDLSHCTPDERSLILGELDYFMLSGDPSTIAAFSDAVSVRLRHPEGLLWDAIAHVCTSSADHPNSTSGVFLRDCLRGFHMSRVRADSAPVLRPARAVPLPLLPGGAETGTDPSREPPGAFMLGLQVGDDDGSVPHHHHTGDEQPLPHTPHHTAPTATVKRVVDSTNFVAAVTTDQDGRCEVRVWDSRTHHLLLRDDASAPWVCLLEPSRVVFPGSLEVEVRDLADSSKACARLPMPFAVHTMCSRENIIAVGDFQGTQVIVWDTVADAHRTIATTAFGLRCITADALCGVALGSNDVKIIDMVSGKELLLVGHSGPVRDVAVCSPMHIVSISHLGDCRVWRPVNLRKSRVAKYACQSAPASN